ncbi:phage tail protein [Clostridioides sp. ZZV14-6045]|uniref:phage tail protein n=1 Tax=unclassified Clostridioides TaxID=2635829 RepID=UPI001D103D9C|nr:phage tail protein [Clostridioides sp. ZZV14-6045]MCC0732635.1 phage tail protein [Clostridioides sp. ZZV14-6048]
MSWAETYKVNSDLQGEPLNFLNYLQDIKLNGLDSYVLHAGNVRIWEELYLNSLYLFSDKGIRDTVYTAFSEIGIDNLFNKSTKLGEQLNAFYRTDVYALGNADDVVKGMTIEHYNSLEQKFKDGYDRYVTREQEKATIGTWFNSTFSLDNTDLEGFTTINDILANTEATNTILNNSNAIVALTMCKSSMDAVVASPSAMDLLGQYILRVTTEPQVIRAIIKNEVVRDAIINSDEAMTQISTNSNSVLEILKDIEAVKTLLENTNSINKILSNNEISSAIIPKIIQSKDILTKVSNSTETIKNNIVYVKEQCNTNMYNEDVFAFLKETIEIYEKIEGKIPNLEESSTKFISIADLIINNAKMTYALANNATFIDTILSNTSVLTVAINNSNMMKAISASQTTINKVIRNSTALNLCINSATAMRQIAENSTAVNAIINYPTAFTAIMNNTSAFSYIANNNSAMTVITNNTSAMNQVLNNSNAINGFTGNSNAMNKITGTALALNMFLKTDASRVKLATSPYLQAYYSNIASTVTNTTYFAKGSNSYIDNGDRIATTSGGFSAGSTPTQCLYMSLVIGSWSNGRETTGNIAHLQNRVIVKSVKTTIGDITSGNGESARNVCVGGCAFTETNDSGTYGYMVYAK